MNHIKESFKFLVLGLISYGLVTYGLITSNLESALEGADFIFSSLLLALTFFIVCQLVSNKILQPPE